MYKDIHHRIQRHKLQPNPFSNTCIVHPIDSTTCHKIAQVIRARCPTALGDGMSRKIIAVRAKNTGPFCIDGPHHPFHGSFVSVYYIKTPENVTFCNIM